MSAPKDIHNSEPRVAPRTAPPAPTSAAGPSGGPAGAPATKQGRAVSVGQVLAGILLVAVIIFIAENNDDVRIRIIAGPKVTMPMWMALFAAALVGALIAALMRYRRTHRTKNRRV